MFCDDDNDDDDFYEERQISNSAKTSWKICQRTATMSAAVDNVQRRWDKNELTVSSAITTQ